MKDERKTIAEIDWAEFVRLQDKAKTKCKVLKSARLLYYYHEKNPNSRNFKEIDVRLIYLNSLEEAISALMEYSTFLKNAGLSAQLEHDENEINSILSEYKKFTSKENTFNQN